MNSKTCLECSHYRGTHEPATYFEPEYNEFDCPTVEASTEPNIEQAWNAFIETDPNLEEFAQICPHFEQRQEDSSVASSNIDYKAIYQEFGII